MQRDEEKSLKEAKSLLLKTLPLLSGGILIEVENFLGVKKPEPKRESINQSGPLLFK